MASSTTDQPVYTEPRFRLLRDCWNNRVFRSFRKGQPGTGYSGTDRRRNTINYLIRHGLAQWESDTHKGHPCKRLLLTVDGHALMKKWEGEAC